MFDNVTMIEAIARIDQLLQRDRPALVVTPNADHVVRMQRDRQYATIVSRADLVLADGQPVIWASRLLGTPLKERVAGSDLLPRLCEHAAIQGYRVFFLGGDPGAAEGAKAVLERKCPDLQVVGASCPPYGFERSPAHDDEVVAAVRSARPDILFVGLGSPKQEVWIDSHQHKHLATVSIGIGISFGFVSGQVKRAPVWMQRAGLEWFHRLGSEPGRLWKRYIIRGPQFITLLAGELWHKWIFRPSRYK